MGTRGKGALALALGLVAFGAADRQGGSPTLGELHAAPERVSGERSPAAREPAPAEPAPRTLRLHGGDDGDYGGVVPGKPAPGARKPAPDTVTWVGFQPRGDAAVVFVQLTSAPTYTQRVAGRELLVEIPGVRLGADNHRRPLDTTFFETPVVRVEARPLRGIRKGRKRRAAGVTVAVTFRGTAREAAARVEQGAHGYHYLLLEIPPRAGEAAAAPRE